MAGPDPGAHDITTLTREAAAIEAPAKAPRRVDLPRLTGLRAFAALAVFFCHMNEDLNWQPANYLREGYAGVSFFFMLSGFVLTWSAVAGKRPGVAKAGGFKASVGFYRRRIARVWPVHLAVLVIFFFVFNPTRATWPTGPLLATVFLVQAWNVAGIYAIGINAVAWSLSCEAFFYAVWPIIVRPFTALSKWISWAIVLVLYGVLLRATWDYFAFAADKRFFPYLFPPIRLVEFLAGVLLASMMQKGWRCRIPLPVAFLLLCVEVYGLRTHNWHVVSFPGLLFDPLLLLLIASAATADIKGRSGWLKSRILTYMGKISFAFYLVHVATLQWIQIHLPHVALDTNSGVLLIFAGSAATAMMLHHLVEVPANQWLRPRHDKPLSV